MVWLAITQLTLHSQTWGANAITLDMKEPILA